ncbi:MAG TPA: FeoB-associated Cys-rich membrane protein [Pirellulales bacterium]
MDWQDAVVWVIIAVSATHLFRALILPAFFKRPASGPGCASGCGSCPSNAAAKTASEPAVFGLTLAPPSPSTTKPPSPQ